MITSNDVIPDDFRVPCNFLKCAKKNKKKTKTKQNVCPCRMKLISCCKCCKCGTSTSRSNTFK